MKTSEICSNNAQSHSHHSPRRRLSKKSISLPMASILPGLALSAADKVSGNGTGTLNQPATRRQVPTRKTAAAMYGKTCPIKNNIVNHRVNVFNF